MKLSSPVTMKIGELFVKMSFECTIPKGENSKANIKANVESIFLETEEDEEIVRTELLTDIGN